MMTTKNIHMAELKNVCDPESKNNNRKKLKETDIQAEKIRHPVVVDECIDGDDELSCVIHNEEFVDSGITVKNDQCIEEKDTDDKETSEDVISSSIQDTETPIAPLGPFATQQEIEEYEYQKKRFMVYQKHNMFYVPSYEDSPLHLPHIASIREESTSNSILKKSLNRESFTYNSWLRRNSYNTSSEHAHIVDDHALSTPGRICAHPKKTPSNQLMLSARRISDVPAHRRPSIASQKQQSLLQKKQYTWIEGVHLKSKESVDIASFDHLKIPLPIPEKSPHDCDARMFTFKAKPIKISSGDRRGAT
jgi:hypothetical protein